MTAAQPSPSAKPKRPKPFEKPAVALRGGPRDRWWYFEDDVHILLAAAEHTGTCSELSDYQPSDETIRHPDGLNVGTVWIYAR
jgi:hypothetical protein